ncbi:FRG domain-containing protein [Pseudomonas plecoglossicida]|uniref:FRG domain-containing protein n=1 Tax=Pseudomonas plecoglossicida TaxID=70775 RepID=A0AAD0QU83_PSEDL|nr:FRG domain-containing protein [Pseudomonas plecoglossicida]AXM95739.1 FRG domain-containing protein [Pseudomonas plecoglossicida]EPB96784.1 FRG domain-containing protein [Pseudomonas plecoglossicida NB2011]QLB56491.1 FRG domain-containing protein [Pseudomonas plecoglossicida]GLR38443.1 hypothetical protein GCM10011247_38410 [Pseudomonas plecoglossicida]
MYNFLVTSREGAWESGYEYDKSRFLEYTNDDIAASFKELKEPQLKALMELPCLFAYEGTQHTMRVGKVEVKLRRDGKILFARPIMDARIAPIDFEQIKPHQTALDIRDWEINRTHWAVKDEDLFAILHHAGLLPEGIVGSKVTKEDLPATSPPETRANSVGTFIEQVFLLNHGSREVFYRGHSNSKKYRLEPSIFRRDQKGNFVYRDAEDRMYRELLVSNSLDFSGDIYTLDRLVRMQHYSLPTRLLDITSNPLIGLYFCCKSHLDDDGEVIVLSMDTGYIKYFDSDTASCVANLSRLSKGVRDSISFEAAGVEDFNAQRALKQLLHFIKEEKPFFEPRLEPEHLRSVLCVKGKHTNSRISFQSGAFLLFGDEAVLDEEGTSDITLHRIAVTNKRSILKELDRLNINESTVFPYIESSAKYIAQKFAFQDNE